MICKVCKKEIPNEAIICPNCGALIEEESLQDTCVLTENSETGLLDKNDKDKIDSQNEIPVVDMYTNNGSRPVDNIIADKNVNSAYINPTFNHTETQNSIQNPQQQTQNNAIDVQNPYNNPNQNHYSDVSIPKQNYLYQNQPQYQANPPYQSIQTPNSQFQQSKKLNYKEFYKAFASKKTKNAISWTGTICIFTMVVSFAFFGMYQNTLSIMDILFYGIFSVLILKLRKWQVIVPVCIYSGVFSIIGVILTSTPSGILAVVVSIIAVVKAKRIDDAYKHYLMTNQYPTEKI